VFTDDARIKDLNWRFRGKERITDVIAFSMRGIQERDPSGSLLGDIYISVPQARAQAKDYGVTEEEEIRRLVVHGVLHVLGYDDAEKGQARKMRQHEDQHLEKSEAGNRARSGRRSRQHSRDA
jgi:probable rRNA maturation factor